MSEEKKMYERIDESSQFDGPVRDSHESRYRIAAGYAVPDGFVLDAGCGIGYGKQFFNEHLYLGIDRNPPTGSRFLKVDFEDKNQKYDNLPEFDIFVGLECIEHLDGVGVDSYRKLAHKAKKWIIVSTPIIPNSNAFHKQQFTQEIMERMFVNTEWRHYQTFKQNDAYGIFIFERI